MKDSNTKVMFARMMPRKGRDAYAIRQVTNDLESLGHPKIILKSDNEPAIKALKDCVRMESSLEMVMEESPAYDQAGNGVVENAVKIIQGQFRTMKEALQTRVNKKINGDHQCIPLDDDSCRSHDQ